MPGGQYGQDEFWADRRPTSQHGSPSEAGGFEVRVLAERPSMPGVAWCLVWAGDRWPEMGMPGSRYRGAIRTTRESDREPTLPDLPRCDTTSSHLLDHAEGFPGVRRRLWEAPSCRRPPGQSPTPERPTGVGQAPSHHPTESSRTRTRATRCHGRRPPPARLA